MLIRHNIGLKKQLGIQLLDLQLWFVYLCPLQPNPFQVHGGVNSSSHGTRPGFSLHSLPVHHRQTTSGSQTSDLLARVQTTLPPRACPSSGLKLHSIWR